MPSFFLLRKIPSQIHPHGFILHQQSRQPWRAFRVEKKSIFTLTSNVFFFHKLKLNKFWQHCSRGESCQLIKITFTAVTLTVWRSVFNFRLWHWPCWLLPLDHISAGFPPFCSAVGGGGGDKVWQLGSPFHPHFGGYFYRVCCFCIWLRQV